MTFEYYTRSSTTATTTSSKNKKHLTLETVPKSQRKYLGEPDDPHFIPKSPIITRQQFTEQEEGELKRLCALALAEVPHSDGPDPVAPPSAVRATHAPTARKASAPVPQKQVIKPPQPQYVEDSRTPSEGSRRDTLGTATDYSTPLTSAGITPGEPAKRFSSSKTQNSSLLRYDEWNQQQQQQQQKPLQQRGKSHTDPQPSLYSQQRPASQPNTKAVRKSAASAPGEKTLRFVKDSRDPSPSSKFSEVNKSNASLVKLSSPDPSRPSNRFSQAELNKKLPPLPDNLVDHDTGPKTAPLARMLKGFSRKKSSAQLRDEADEDDSEQPLRSLPPERPGTSFAFARSVPSSPALGGVDGSRRKFLKLFGRKNREQRPGTAEPIAA
jgi:hypothetical protein